MDVMTTDQEEINLPQLREAVQKLARENVIKVTFIKKDGSTREMKCTLKEDVVAAFPGKTFAQSKRAQNLDVLPVFDVDVSDWRSFRIDSIQRVEIA